MNEAEMLEYSCSECNNIVDKEDVICNNCGADLSEIIEEYSVQNQHKPTPKFINIVAIIFLIFNFLKLLNNTTIALGIVIIFISGGNRERYIEDIFRITTFEESFSVVFSVLIFLDWIPTTTFLIASIGLLMRKKWSLNLFNKSLYFAGIINIIMIAFSLFIFHKVDTVFLFVLQSYLLVQTIIFFLINRKLTSERYKNFPLHFI